MAWPGGALDLEPLDIAIPDLAPDDPPEADLLVVWAWSCCILDCLGGCAFCWWCYWCEMDTGPVGVCTLVLAAFSFTYCPNIYVCISKFLFYCAAEELPLEPW